MAHGLRYYISLHITSSHCMAVFPTILVLACTGLSIPGSRLSLRVPTVLFILQYRNINLLSIGHGPALTHPDSPRADQLYPGNLDIRPEDSHLYLATHSGILFHIVHSLLRYCFFPYAMLLYNPYGFFSFWWRVSAPDISAAHPRPVSYYAPFECMAASEPTSWLSSKSHTSFPLNALSKSLTVGLALSL